MTLNELKILSVLRKGPNYGLGIIERIKEAQGDMSTGGIYNTLVSMEKKGLIEKGEVKDKRQYWQISSVGEWVLAHQMSCICDLWDK